MSRTSTKKKADSKKLKIFKSDKIKPRKKYVIPEELKKTRKKQRRTTKQSTGPVGRKRPKAKSKQSRGPVGLKKK